MTVITRRAFTTAVLALWAKMTRAQQNSMTASVVGMTPIELPDPSLTGGTPLTEAVNARRSVREFRAGALGLEAVSQLLWAAQGVTSREGFRAPPSAGALYPLEVDIAVGAVDRLAEGIYRYLPASHGLVAGEIGDKRAELAAAAYGQRWIADSALILIISAVYERTTVKYGRRGMRYVHMEAGHAAQNVLLSAVALGLGATPVGAFDDARVARIAGLSMEEEPLYLVASGRR